MSDYNLSNPVPNSVGWALHEWGTYPNNMLLSISLCTGQDTSLAHVAAGWWDNAYKQTAADVVAKFPNAIIRIGWEMNGGWYPWAAKGREQDYINAFRRVAQIFLSYSSTFTIDWCPSIGTGTQMDPTNCYPGDDIVDVISLDAYYDVNWATPPNKNDPNSRWTWFVNQNTGLQWHLNFATQHNKPMGFPEWGINIDDPVWIQNMYTWITTHNFAYASYWNSNSNFNGSLTSGTQSNPKTPNASAKYKATFGTIAYNPLVPTTTTTGSSTPKPTTPAPTSHPTSSPTSAPTSHPTSAPTSHPTSAPTSVPTSPPTAAPTTKPTSAPTSRPTSPPTSSPTSAPTSHPTSPPSNPTSAPTSNPTTPAPTSNLTTPAPTSNLTTPAPTSDPTSLPISASSLGATLGIVLFSWTFMLPCILVVFLN